LSSNVKLARYLEILLVTLTLAKGLA